MDGELWLATLRHPTLSIEEVAQAEAALGAERVVQALLTRDHSLLWQLSLAPNQARRLVYAGAEAGPTGWEPTLSGALAIAKGVHLARATQFEGIADGVCLWVERSVEVSQVLLAMATQLVGESRSLGLRPERLVATGPIERWREATGLLLTSLCESTSQEVEREYGHMGREVVAHRTELDSQRRLHRNYERQEALSEWLREAWETPGWVPEPFWGD